PEGGMQSADFPLVGLNAAEEGAEAPDVSPRVCPERRYRFATVALDRADALGVSLGAPERHRLTGDLPTQHGSGLSDPVGDEFRKMRPHLAAIPPLTAGGIRTGERSRKR